MDDVFRAISEIARWTGPAIGLVVAFLAFRRFGTPGTGLAALGFALMLSGPTGSLAIRQAYLSNDNHDVEQYAVWSYANGLLSAVGFLLVVIAMRRMFRALALSGRSGERATE